MKLKNLFWAFLAATVSLLACNKEEDPNDYPAKVEVSPTTLTFAEGESSQPVEILATRNWTASSTAEWVKVATVMGDASVKKQSVSVSVLANTGHNREAEVIFSIGLAKARVKVTQAGPKGEIDNGKGTKESPYTVAGVCAFVESLGADVESSERVYVKGIISTVSTTFEASGTYGNASFDMMDEDGTLVFKAFQTYYLGNRKWKSGDTDVKAGDQVIICGKVVNYKGNTPETVGKGASFIYGLNGKIVEESTETIAQAKGTGTEADPFNVAAAIAKAKETGETATSQDYYIKGKVSEVTSQFSADFGNATFNMIDEGYTAKFIAYRVLYLNNQKWTAGGKELKAGDEVVVCAKIQNYKGNTPETSGGYVYSINGDKGEQPNPETMAEAKGAGTEADPFNVAAAIAKAKETGETATSQEYYIKGKVSAIANNGQFNAQYGNATFDMIDEGYTAKFVAYRVLYLNNQKWVEGDKELKVGDEVVVCAKIQNYKGNTPETSGGYVYSINGDNGQTAGPSFGVKSNAISVAAAATSATISVTGNVAWTATTTDEGVTVAPASGEGAGDITVSFAANTSTEAEKTYKVVVATEAEVATKSIEVVITQGKASSGNAQTIEVSFAACPEGFPNGSSNGQKDGTYTFGNASFVFHAADKYYWTKSTVDEVEIGYVLIGKKDSYIQLPVVAGKALKKVSFKTGPNASTNVIVDIYKGDTALNVNTGKLDKGKEYSWSVAGEADAAYRIFVTNAYNAQFQYLKLEYE